MNSIVCTVKGSLVLLDCFNVDSTPSNTDTQMEVPNKRRITFHANNLMTWIVIILNLHTYIVADI